MYIERLLVENVRHLGRGGHDFTAGPGQLRRWNVLPAGRSSSALLRLLALAGLGRRQMQGLAMRFLAGLADQPGQPVHLECVQIRHAPQERGASSPTRRHFGWRLRAKSLLAALPKGAARYRDATARFGRPESGQSNTGRLLLGYGSPIQAHAGTDRFLIYPDQRLKRCAGLFDAGARVTDPVAFLQHLRHKSRFRDGRARALLARLSAGLIAWLGWEAGRSLATEGAFEARWLARQYAAQRGRIHHRLIETLFRFNARTRMGGFLHRLEDLCRGRSCEQVPRRNG
jgi:hypothetical protein